MISQDWIQCEKVVGNAGQSSVEPAWFERLMSQPGGDLTDIFNYSPSLTLPEHGDSIITSKSKGYTTGSWSPATRLTVPASELGKKYVKPIKIVEKRCKTCGKVFQSRIVNQVNCPSHTRSMQLRERKYTWKTSRNCKCCGNPFMPNSHNQEYCQAHQSRNCHNYGSKETPSRRNALSNQIRLCRGCGAEFTPKSANQVYCQDHLAEKAFRRAEHAQEGDVPQNHIGARSELLVSYDLMGRGFQVFRNLSPHGIDLIAYGGNGQFLRIESTTGRILSDGRIIAANHKKTRDKWDVLAISLPNNTVAYRKDDLLTPADPILDAG